ncbi:MAG: ISAs1 family transposase [Gemmataceae bacterium]|nr:ISAs1 family transposase [Gemmataceae bacterium]
MTSALIDRLNQVLDPRKAKGRIHDLGPILCLAVVALLAGRTTLQGIAQFGRDHGSALAHALGFRRGKTPCAATYSRIFRRLDVEAFEAVLRDWIVQRCPDLGDHVALDGKTLRGSHDGDTPAVHLLAAFAPKVRAVIGQIRVDAKTNEHKAALRLLGVVPVAGKVVTGDAIFCQTEVTEALAQQHAEYILHVKDNQPTVRERIADLLDPAASFFPGRVPRPGREYGPDDRQGAWPGRGASGPQQ